MGWDGRVGERGLGAGGGVGIMEGEDERRDSISQWATDIRVPHRWQEQGSGNRSKSVLVEGVGLDGKSNKNIRVMRHQAVLSHSD